MILLLDGTSDSRDLACELMASGYSIIATAITSDQGLGLEFPVGQEIMKRD